MVKQEVASTSRRATKGSAKVSKDRSREHSRDLGSGRQEWSVEDFLARLAEARRLCDADLEKRVLKTVAESNYALVQDVSQTVLVRSRDTKQQVDGPVFEPRYTISASPTGDALLHFAALLRPYGKTVCGLNFANGKYVGGGYLNGARAQEEELCRQFPSLYASLQRAKRLSNAYPFGACTYRGGHDAKRYADVLFTPKLVARRASQVQGYRLLETSECLDNMALVSAAAPNLPKGEKFKSNLMLEAIRTIVAAPRLKDPSIDTIVLGAWGCGAFRGDPEVTARLFAQVLYAEGMGRLYREVHFAIPGGNANAQVFEETLQRCGVPLVRTFLRHEGGQASKAASDFEAADLASEAIGPGGLPEATEVASGLEAIEES